MNVRYLNPFVQAAKDVVKAELNTQVTRGDLSLEKSSMTTNELTVLITMVGELQGIVLYSMETRTGLNMVGRVLDQEFNEFEQSG